MKNKSNNYKNIKFLIILGIFLILYIFASIYDKQQYESLTDYGKCRSLGFDDEIRNYNNTNLTYCYIYITNFDGTKSIKYSQGSVN